MLKTAMLVSALALAVPAFAQDQTKPAAVPQPTVPATPQAPVTDTPAQTPTTVAKATPTASATTEAAPAEPATPAANASAATPATGEVASGATQIAQVVNTEFPTYDKNADTNLDKAEFGAWMVALKTASDPATKAGDPATVKWIDGAFASADADKSKSVSKGELTKYLSQGAE